MLAELLAHKAWEWAMDYWDEPRSHEAIKEKARETLLEALAYLETYEDDESL